MSLLDIDFKLQYRSDRNDLIEDFYNPCMKNSIQYDRAVGYFTSNVLTQSAKGIHKFIENEGIMRIIASPRLTEEDVQAIEKGIKARDELVEEKIIKEIEINEENIKNNTLCILAWMVYKGKLEIKIAIPKKIKVGIYHEKFGIFKDNEGNSLAFIGSANETEGGYVNNFESIDVYVSSNARDRERIKIKEFDFKNLWKNATQGLEIIDFPEAAKKELLQYRHRGEEIITQLEKHRVSNINDNKISLPKYLKIRDYQKEALNAWAENKGKGILEMATGTGKTITALYLIYKLYKKFSKLAVIIVCPYKHLVSQWKKEANEFNINSVLCFDSKNTWQNNLKEKINDFNMGIADYLSIMTTNDTFCTDNFRNFINDIKQPILLIFDEAHHVGTEKFYNYLPKHINFRLALSATPNRWFDDYGNRILTEYFHKVVYSFPLEDAIGEFLTPYYYYPHIVYFNDNELEEYYQLSIQIGKCYWRSENKKNNEILKTLLIKRSKLISKAENKILELKKCLQGKEDSKFNLFYTGDAKVDGERQIEKVIKMLGTELGMRVSPFTSKENNKQRQEILERYENGEYQGLVAIRCLDEGVNVPLIQAAYILASSSNPREFIQRRGRVLRKHPSKRYSFIHDFIVIPRNIKNLEIMDDKIFNIERSLMKKELTRVNEFCSTALNGPEALNALLEIKEAYNLLDM